MRVQNKLSKTIICPHKAGPTLGGCQHATGQLGIIILPSFFLFEDTDQFY